ncbi:MAG TPA: deoxyribose-phosphate aldolase [Bdellovibrionota bacterium]|nr:deoxyribose-phosphate aldolase [Bdellovibrionota bacterium]
MRDVKLRVPGGGHTVIPGTPVDQVGVEERAAHFATRSIKKGSKFDALTLAISMVDLTTLEGSDTPGKVRQMCSKARLPVSAAQWHEISAGKDLPEIPSVAAVCVYPKQVPIAAKALAGTNIEVAAVATAFPSGQFPRDLKLKDVKRTIELGATEIDMVIDRDAFLRGDYQAVFDEIVAVKEVCGHTHLKVILETGELQTYDKIRFASWLAMEAGADFIKTSTGKAAVNATPGNTLVMLQAIADYHAETGKMIGMKPAGGIRTAKQALQYLCMVRETLGPAWLTPDMFRFGASVLLNDLLRQIFKQVTGRYYHRQTFSLD